MVRWEGNAFCSATATISDTKKIGAAQLGLWEQDKGPSHAKTRPLSVGDETVGYVIVYFLNPGKIP